MQAVLAPVLDPVADPVADPVGAALAAAVGRVDTAGGDDGAWQWPGPDGGLAALLDRAERAADPPGRTGLRGACEVLAAAAPGPDTLAALGVLSAPGVLAGLDEGARVLLAVAWERAAAWVARPGRAGAGRRGRRGRRGPRRWTARTGAGSPTSCGPRCAGRR